MSEEINELKAEERLKIEIPVEEEEVGQEGTRPDVAAEFQKLGRQFGETLEKAWNSEERQRVEKEVREGLRSFADEVDKVIREAKENPKTAKLKEEAVEAKTKVESSDIGRKMQTGLAQGMRWLSEELGAMSERFGVQEKQPEDVEPEVKEE